MRSTRRHLRRICRRPGDGDYEEIIGKYLVRYRHADDDDELWIVVVRHREFVGEPLSGLYLTVKNVTGKRFESLGDARLAAHANYKSEAMPITADPPEERVRE